jgi:hypothetical protein
MSDIISQLKALKLHGMADSYAELQSQGAPGQFSTGVNSWDALQKLSRSRWTGNFATYSG